MEIQNLLIFEFCCSPYKRRSLNASFILDVIHEQGLAVLRFSQVSAKFADGHVNKTCFHKQEIEFNLIATRLEEL